MGSDVHDVMGRVAEAQGDPCYLAEKYKKIPICASPLLVFSFL